MTIRIPINFQVRDPIHAEVVKVVPTMNNGFSEIVKLHHTKVGIAILHIHLRL